MTYIHYTQLDVTQVTNLLQVHVEIPYSSIINIHNILMFYDACVENHFKNYSLL
jgi:hypothetical protein